MLRIGLATILVLATSGYASADDRVPKLCIMSAAQRLPPIPGIAITASRVSPMPPDGKTQPDVEMLLVEIDVRAAAQDATYQFVCAAGAGKPVQTSPVGLLR